MQSLLLASAFAISLAIGALAVPQTASAANADHPYQNVDKSNDKGNDTGDAKVDTLNRGQLDENQPAPAPSVTIVQPAPAPGTAPTVH